MLDLTLRQSEIMAEARTKGRVMVDDLAKRFDVSPQTIRKDLNDLCDRMALSRIHGGAIVSSGAENIAYAARRQVATDEKRSIGKAAAALIPNNCSLFLNIGTTTEEVANSLATHEDLLVITNNLNVAMQLHPRPRIKVIVMGGTVRPTDGGIVGPTAVDLVKSYKADYAVIGISAIDDDGALLEYDSAEVLVTQAIIANARHTILVTDASKLTRNAPVRVANIGDIGTLVTDDLGNSPIRELCKAKGVQVIETGRAS